MGDFGFFLFLLALVVLFTGEPDLHDRMRGAPLDCPSATEQEQ